jgi:alpha-N-arabinofuranosidase
MIRWIVYLEGYIDHNLIDILLEHNDSFRSCSYVYLSVAITKASSRQILKSHFISTTYNEANTTYNYTISIPPSGKWDTHHYETPSFFLEQFDYWDNWQEATDNENVTIFVGEYAAFQADTFDGVINYTPSNPYHIAHPSLLGAIAASVYLIGAERNLNVVKMTTYAPSFQNPKWLNGNPAFTADYGQTVWSVSYYSQQMFAHHQGTETLPVATVGRSFNPLWWVATIDDTERDAPQSCEFR